MGLLLHYPAVNLTQSGSLSRMIFCHDPILNYQTTRCVLGCYLGERAEEADTNPLISPLFASDEVIAQFPNTVISVGDVDPLIDDSTAFFDRLQGQGVHAVLRIFGTLPHGFLNLPTQLPKAINAIKDGGIYMKWLYDSYQSSLPEC